MSLHRQIACTLSHDDRATCLRLPSAVLQTAPTFPASYSPVHGTAGAASEPRSSRHAGPRLSRSSIIIVRATQELEFYMRQAITHPQALARLRKSCSSQPVPHECIHVMRHWVGSICSAMSILQAADLASFKLPLIIAKCSLGKFIHPTCVTPHNMSGSLHQQAPCRVDPIFLQ